MNVVQPIVGSNSSPFYSERYPALRGLLSFPFDNSSELLEAVRIDIPKLIRKLNDDNGDGTVDARDTLTDKATLLPEIEVRSSSSEVSKDKEQQSDIAAQKDLPQPVYDGHAQVHSSKPPAAKTVLDLTL